MEARKLGIAILILVGIITASFVVAEMKNGLYVGNADAALLGGNTLYVGGSGPNNYTNIQDAIDDANNGDTIFVFNGTYYGNVVVNKRIDLVGEDRNATIIDGGENGDVIYVTADWVNITGFTVQNGGSNWDDAGIELHGVQNCHIENNNISNNLIGIYLQFSSSCTITGNTMVGNGIVIFGDLMEHWNTHTIDTLNTVNGKPLYYWKDVTGGTVPEGAGQVILANCTGVIIENQNVSNGSEGIELGFSSSCNMISNTIINNAYGIYLYYSGSNIILDNNISNKGVGIWLDDSGSNTILGNNISNNLIGVYLTYSNNNIHNNIHYNNICGNYYYGICNCNGESECTAYASSNYWGSADGPGSGDAVTSNVIYEPWSTEPYERGGNIADAYELDNDHTQATWIATYGATQTHNFHIAGDEDWIKFNAVDRSIYIIETLNLGADCNTYVYLYSLDGTTEITYDDNSGERLASKIIWNCNASGTYYVKIRHHDSNVSGILTYYDVLVKQSGLVHNLNKDTYYYSIQDAIDNASYGDTIFVYNGTYYENIVINKRIILIGENKETTIIDGRNVGNVVTITAGGVIIEGFTVRNSSMEWWSNGGINLNDVQNCRIENNNISNNLIGVYLMYSDNNNISGNTISNNNNYGIYLDYSSNNNNISSNIINNNEDGIELSCGSSNIVLGNIMIKNSISISGHSIEHWNTHSIDISNTVNGKPVYYWKNVNGGTV
ncbi:MAG: right-handed parallel beta-helix repeat-containing protein, partial [Candidatus Thorarchaeota archaeon]